MLTVQEGFDKPYLYKSKAYWRSDTATIEVDRVELTRLILEGKNTSYEELPAQNQDLSFNILDKLLHDTLGIEKVSKDILTTLMLYDKKSGYNIAAELLADHNSFSGIDSVRFGDSISVILDRESYEYESILSQYYDVIGMFKSIISLKKSKELLENQKN